MRGTRIKLWQVIAALVLLHPPPARAQKVGSDTAYARADRLFFQADTLAQSVSANASHKALVLWREALSVYEAGRHQRDAATVLPRLGATYHRIAADHKKLGLSDSAHVYYAKALRIWREIGDRPSQAIVLHDIGVLHAGADQLDSALAFFSQALPIRREVGDRTGEAATLAYLGSVHGDRGHPDSAIFYYALALPMLRAGGNRSGEGTSLTNMGRQQAKVGQPDSALASYHRALPIWRGLLNRSNEALTLHLIGAAYLDIGRLDSALAYNTRALPLARETGKRSIEAGALNDIGAAHDDLGRSDSALVYYGRALSIEHELENRVGEARTLGNIGGIHKRSGRPDSALAYHRRALGIQREMQDRSREGTSLHNIGAVQDDMGRSDSALAYYALALAIEREVGNRIVEGTTLGNIGAVLFRLGRPDSALVYMARALALQREVGQLPGQAFTLAGIGRMLLRSTADGSARSSAAAYDSSAALRARMRRSAGGDANAVSFSERGGDTFGGWSRAWQQLAGEARLAGDTFALGRAVASSLAAAERGRAQALRDLLDRRPGASAAGPDASDTLPGADLAAEAGRLLAPLKSSRTALLYYLTDGDTLRTWFLSPDGALEALSPIGQAKGELAQQISTTRGHLGADSATVRLRRAGSPRGAVRQQAARRPRLNRDGLGGAAGNFSEASAALQRLSAGVLPAGIETLLPAGTELVIVPHGALGQLPFAALTLPGDTVPLGVRNSLRYAPSLRALVAAEARDAPPSAGAGKALGRALVVGNPLMPEVRDETGAMRQLSELDGAAEEGRWVASRLGTTVLTGIAASESAVRRLLSGASVVHLATHGLAYGTEARVRDSYVALAPGGGHDGLLTLGELLDDESLRLTTDLFVLSACQTGLGEAREAEGTVGLQRGLLAKGARSVLVSLWSVDDAATRLLMEKFYTHWLGPDGRPAISKAEALRRAQNDVRSKEAFRNPRYWAAFQLVGAR